VTRSAAFALFLTAGWLSAQPATPQPPSAPLPAAPAAKAPVTDDGVRVSVLGYHDFNEKESETAMRMHTSKFRKQLETIRQLGIPVVSMEDFLAWKHGKKTLPPRCIVITIDDGWRSVYTDGFPLLKQFGYPFTLFLYKQYVDCGGKSLSTDMIQEMEKSGAYIGCHSVTHPYPAVFRTHKKRGAADYEKFLRVEMGESRDFLASHFGVKITTYAYPGGYITDEMLPLADEFGYTDLFTVIPGKVTRNTEDHKIPRYMILGNYDKVFEMATSFHEAGAATTPAALAQTTPYPVSPDAGAVVNSRLPLIAADLSKVPDLNPATVTMKVAGFGEVPATFDPATKRIAWQVNRKLRQQSCQVSVTWKDKAGKAPENPLRWAFQIDRGAAYLPDGD
jgi:peptidoglycan/xylan/chitin deacetylase (PgdA/CDA1 family)